MADGGVNIYTINNLTFILTPEKILIKTHYQMFTLEPTTHYWNRRMRLIRAMIELNEIRDLNELATYCHNGDVAWLNVNHNRYVDMVTPVMV